MKPFWPLGATAAASMFALAGKLRAPFLPLPALSMRQFLTLLVLSATLPMLALALFMSATMMATERQAARGGLFSNVRTLATVIDNEIDVHLAIAATLATSPLLRAGDLTAFKQQAIQALAVVPGAWLNISTPSGQIVMSTLAEDGVPLPIRNTLGPMQQAFASRQPQVSDVALGQFTKRMNASADVPVFKDDRPLYSIIIGLNPDRFLAILRNNYSPRSVVGLLDRNANFVARIPDHDGRVGTLAAEGWRAAIAQSPEGFSESDTLEGEPSLVAYVKTKFGWTVGIAALDRIALAPVRRLQWLLAFVGGALTLASLALGFGLARKISVSMQSLMDSTLLIDDGKTVEARAFAVREVTDISRILSVTSQTIAARTADLKQAHDTFLNLVQNAPFGVYLVDSDFRIAKLSPGAAEMFANVEPPTVLGRELDEVLREVWPEPIAGEAIARFRHTLETGEKYRQGSMQGKRRDTGNDEAYDWQIERVTMPSGKFGIVCYFYDLTELNRVQAALLEREAQFRGTFENAAVGVAHVALDGRLLEVNNQLSEILGFTRDELRTKTFQEITHPDDLTPDLDNLKKLLAGDIESYTMDKRYLCGDGRYKWGGLTVALRRDASGTPLYFTGIVRDITERKAAQEHQHFLLTELAHRMKNQLAVIQAMAGQTARKADSLKEFQELFGQRLQGLAIATDILVAQGWHGAPLGELVERQLKPFIPSPDRFVCNGVKLSVTSDATQAIGLALHELATNAVKHGAWSSDGGRVIVSWQFIADDTSESRLQIVWREEGGPTVASPSRKGFGHVVIESMAAQRLGGTAELLFPPDGLHWTLTIPTTHIVAGAASSGGGRQSDRRQVNNLNTHRNITIQ